MPLGLTKKLKTLFSQSKQIYVQTEKVIKIDASRLLIRLSSSAKLSTHKLYSYKRNLDLDTAYCANSKRDNLNISCNLKFAVQIQEFAMTR